MGYFVLNTDVKLEARVISHHHTNHKVCIYSLIGIKMAYLPHSSPILIKIIRVIQNVIV